MKSDVIQIKTDGTGLSEALTQADAVAAYKTLSPKEALHLRLLTEELAGMVRAMTGNTEASFWIEDENGPCRLHLTTRALVTGNMREELMGVSTSGKNIAAKGFIGKMVELFERSLEPVVSRGADDSANILYITQDPEMNYSPVWSLSSYREAAETGKLPQEEWDELEKSIVTHLADEVEVGIRERRIEMIVTAKRE